MTVLTEAANTVAVGSGLNKCRGSAGLCTSWPANGLRPVQNTQVAISLAIRIKIWISGDRITRKRDTTRGVR